MESRLPVLSLRAKLVLSYLAVTLGAIFMLSIVVSIAIQNSFTSSQQEQLRSRTEDFAQQLGQIYSSFGNWQLAHTTIEIPETLLVKIVDASDTQLDYLIPPF